MKTPPVQSSQVVKKRGARSFGEEKLWSYGENVGECLGGLCNLLCVLQTMTSCLHVRCYLFSVYYLSLFTHVSMHIGTVSERTQHTYTTNL